MQVQPLPVVSMPAVAPSVSPSSSSSSSSTEPSAPPSSPTEPSPTLLPASPPPDSPPSDPPSVSPWVGLPTTVNDTRSEAGLSYSSVASIVIEYSPSGRPLIGNSSSAGPA